MTVELKQQKNAVMHLAVKDELTIYTAQELKNQLFDYLKSAKQLHIDLGDVPEIDSAGVQLLMFLKQESLSRGIKLNLLRHSQAVVQAFELLNLSTYFGDPIVISADWKSS